MDDSVIEKATSCGKDFVGRFYDYIDNNRTKLQELYNADAQIVWCGNAMQAKALAQFYTVLPLTKHSTEALEVQPSYAIDGTILLMVVVKGIVSFGSDNPKPFSQNFLMVQQPDQSWMIQCDCFRLDEQQD
eukprot:m.107429 g.107429  ORF g.107429 m.107429 type:complete len:131 (-) comp27796_c1_seq1:173-565(-)